MDLPQHALTGLAWMTWAGAGAAILFALDLRVVVFCVGAAVSTNGWIINRRSTKAVETQTREQERLARELAASINDRVLNIERLMGWGARSVRVADYDAASLRERDNLHPTDTGPFRIVKGLG